MNYTKSIPCKNCITLSMCKGITNEKKVDGFINKIIPKCSIIREFLYISKYSYGGFDYDPYKPKVYVRFNMVKNFFKINLIFSKFSARG